MADLFRRILVPHDFSEPATRALAAAADLARARRGRLTVLHAITPYPAAGLPPVEAAPWFPPAELLADTKRQLERLVAKTVRGAGAPRVDVRVVIGNPVDRILDAARRADSIVMGTTGRTGLSHLLIGSVAERVVRHATVPVLTVRPGATRRRRAAPGGRRRTRRAARRPR
jgi:nucleotide-binding universal stress UspA family protein